MADTADGSDIAAHYARGNLLTAIEAGLAVMGLTPSTVSAEHLGPVDEFHVGGRAATVELCAQLEVTPTSALLDIGSGIGGTARFIASTTGCHVTGIDITPEYVEVAQTLSEWTSLDHRLDFHVGSALDMPFPDASFDAATQLHVGMNIDDKTALFREVHRVTRAGGRFAVYDIMKMSDGDVEFPVPWASDSSSSFVDDLATYRLALEAAGFQVEAERNRGEFAVEFFRAARERTEKAGGPPPLGLHVIIGPDAPVKISHLIDALTAGALAPVEIICRRS